MADIDREIRRNRKIARTLIRLKHSLAADEEIQAYLDAEQQSLQGGILARVDTNLKELLGDS